MESIFIPLITKRWKVLKENIIFVKRMMPLLDEMTIHFIKAIDSILEEREEMQEMEKVLYSNINDTASILYRTTILKLRPEYELYDIILGKPIKPETYNDFILHDILKLLEIDTITFKKTKEYILNKYVHRN